MSALLHLKYDLNSPFFLRNTKMTIKIQAYIGNSFEF
jgi:hypothetical protein